MNEEFWNQRYKINSTVYGDQPNTFFKEELLKLQSGKLLLPAEGEGRNALFAASIGWEVTAFDFSVEARKKALEAALAKHLKIAYTAEDINEIILPEKTYDAIGLIYVHLESALRATFHKKCMKALKPGGVIILEAFSKNQMNNTSGGPKDMSMLHSRESLLKEFDGLQISLCKEEDTFLDEGKFHAGIAAVVRLVAIKQ